MLVRSSHLSSDDLSDMVDELLYDCFVLDDFVSGFDLFFEICGHIVQRHVLPSLLHLLFAFRLLTLEKQFGGICSFCSMK